MPIALLPENVSNQIAAGEVIERPANVVKELMENSLDAEATSIEVQFRSGGNSLIQVSDNGKGMDEEDALLCFKRHATSKLTTIDDLQTLHSFGFRGEAIPSIASVSKMTLKTKLASNALGTCVETEDGKTFKSVPCACPKGTRFTVEQLFFNVPVRRKFLKSEATEGAHIVNSVRLYAAAYPNVQFTLKQDDRVVFSVQPCENIYQRIAHLWVKRSFKSWLKIDDIYENFQMEGWICPPGEGYASRQELYIFLNQRPIVCSFLFNTLRDCYHGYLPARTYPSGFLFLKIPGSDFDINVHPSKREVRFKNEQKLRQWVANVVGQALTSVRIQPLGIQHTEKIPNFTFQSKETTLKPWVSDESKITKVHADIKLENFSTEKPIVDTVVEKDVRQVSKDSLQQKTQLKPHLQFFALWKNRYAFFNEPPYLLVFDCVGAQKRIQYERILQLLEKNNVGPLQNMLFPHTFTLNPIDAVCLSESIDCLKLRKICTIISKTAQQFELHALPQWVPLEQIDIFINHLIQSLLQYGQSQSLTHLFEPFLRKISQVYAPQVVLNEAQVQHLQAQLSLCQNPISDPEGNRLWKQFSESDLLR